MKWATCGNCKELCTPNPWESFPKDRQRLSKSYYKILVSGAMNRKLKASMFYCYPTSSGLLTLFRSVAKMIHISSYILLLLLCTNKSILGNLMNQYVLGGSFEDLECMNIGGFCVKQMGMNKMTSSQIAQCLRHMYLLRSQMSVAVTLEMHSVTALEAF